MQTQAPPLRALAMTSRKAECVTLRETGAALAFCNTTSERCEAHAQHSRHPTLTYAMKASAKTPRPYCMASDDESGDHQCRQHHW